MKKINSFLALAAALAIIAGCSKKEDDKLSFSVSQTTTYDFPSETGSDYGPKTPLTVTITNTGNLATGKMSLAIDGAAADKFNLSKSSIDNIAAGGSDTFTVAPIQGLAKGDYQATVYVSCKGASEQKFGVRFVVTDMDVVSIEISSPPTKTVYAVWEPLDLTGLVVNAKDSSGKTTPLENVEEYLVSAEFPDDELCFATPGDKKVGIAVGAAPVQEFDVKVLSLRERFADAAGTTATIVVYGNETVTETVVNESPVYAIPINVEDTQITLTTPEGSTKERVITKDFTTTLFSINGGGGNIKLTIDGYVTLKGMATQNYGGTDDRNSTNPLISISTGAFFEMKGHSKITGNVVAKTSGTWTDGAAIKVNSGSQCIIGGDAQVTKNGFVTTGDTGNIYGGAIWFNAAGTVLRIKDNAKISENFIHSVAASLGGAIGGEVNATLYMEGGEVSGNYVKCSGGAANGGAFCLINGTVKAYFSGGTIKDNYLLFKSTYAHRGSAIVANNAEAVNLSGSISIPAGSLAFTDDGDFKKDTGNSISMGVTGTGPLSVNPINIEGTLSTTSKMMIDLYYDTNNTTGLADLNADTRLLRKYTMVDGVAAITDFDGDAPADKFMVRHYINYRGNSYVDISSKTINANGYMTTP